ncbi:hypothetical protein N566_10765 [Streptomycetaceae bacterium MP113-05]|nr:hypothetical protein N566_10765 [Streptomycetaceae bacterium MP113-05]
MAEKQHAEEPAERPAPPAATDENRGSGREVRRVARLAKHINAFAASHGGSAEGQISYLGQRGARIVLVGENGAWGDLVAPSVRVAEQAVERAGITVHEKFDGAMAARLRTGRYEWSRMAGIQIGGPSDG